MTLTDPVLIDKIPYGQLDAYRYFPDFLPYLLNEQEFKLRWLELLQSRYIYANGIEIRPASWLRYIFESIKGLFGFTNHCQSEIVTLGLMKFAYYGYTKGYTHTLQNPGIYPIPDKFAQSIVSPCNSQLSEQLQNQLVNYYLDNRKYYHTDDAYYLIYPNHAFGETLAVIGAYEYIPLLDPVNTKVINTAVKNLEKSNAGYPFIQGSNYAKAAAIYNVKESEEYKGKLNQLLSWIGITEDKVYYHLKRALSFDPNCKIDNLEVYINFYCQHNELELAFQLIEKLIDTDTAVSTYLVKKPFSTEFLLNHVSKDSPIGKSLAVYYLDLSYRDENVKLASQFSSQIESIHPQHVFRYFVDKHNFEDAYKIFNDEKNSALYFHSESKTKLASHFDKLGEKKYYLGNKLRTVQNWPEAKNLYLQSLLMKNRAKSLEPYETVRGRQYLIHLRLYAQILIDANLQCDIKDANSSEITKAISFLRKCQSEHPDESESRYINKALAKGLMLYSEKLCESYKVDYIYERDLETRKNHDKQHKSEIALACKLLSEIIQIPHNSKDTEMKKLKAKAYFLLGDIIDYFNLTDQNYNPIDCHREAYNLVRDNPFYILRYAELMRDGDQATQEKLTEIALGSLRKAGYSVTRYMNWFDERWQKEKIGFHGIVNIHTAEVPKESTWFGKLGF